MNVLILYRCFWWQQINSKLAKAINYYIQYERINHTKNANFEHFGNFKFLINHEDDLDKEIYKALFESLSLISGIKDLTINRDEIVLFPTYEDRNRALLSNMAYGYNFRRLTINTPKRQLVQCATRLMFSNPIEFKDLICPSIPFSIDIDNDYSADSIIRADFLDPQRVDLILERENDISLI
mgnify:CR=1 FL=1